MGVSVPCPVCGAHLKAENEAAHMRKVHPREPFQSRQSAGAPPSGSRFYVTSGAKKTIFAALVTVILVVAGAMLFLSTEKSVPVDPNAKAVQVSMAGFSPNTITVKAGVPLKIDLINMDNQYHTDGGGWHNFAIDAFGMNVSVQPLGQQVFTVPTGTPGTYDWYCSVCCGGRDSPSMNGRLVVQA